MELSPALQLGYYVVATLGALGSIVAGVWAWSAKQAIKTARIAEAAAQVPVLQEKLADAEKELGGHRERIRALEKLAASAPTERMFADIHTIIARLEGKIDTAAVRTENAAKSADAALAATERIEGFFLAKGVKA